MKNKKENRCSLVVLHRLEKDNGLVIRFECDGLIEACGFSSMRIEGTRILCDNLDAELCMSEPARRDVFNEFLIELEERDIPACATCSSLTGSFPK